MDWVSILLYYCLTGIVVLTIVFLSHKWSERKSESVRDILDSVQRQLNLDNEKSFREKIEDFVIPVIAAILIIAVWPIVPIIKLKDVFSSRSEQTIETEKEFSVEEKDLVERFSKEQIEDKEKIVDPLKAVPNLPFGHLNAVWESFLENMEEGDQIWSFSADWEDWKGKETRKGYALIRQGHAHHYMITDIC